MFFPWIKLPLATTKKSFFKNLLRNRNNIRGLSKFLRNSINSEIFF